MSARQLQDLLSSVVKLPVANNANANAANSNSASNSTGAAGSAAAAAGGGSNPCSDRRCHLSHHRHRHNSSSSDLVYFSPSGDVVGMSSGDKWKGMFGRLRNRTRHKRRLSVKPPNGSLDNASGFIKDEELGNISGAEVKTWGESFEKLMSSEKGRVVFRAFLRCEYSEENILFWLACEDLKKERSPELIEEKARIIYEDYVSILSPREVSLDSRVREIINRNMIAPSQHTFDEAQLQIYTLMHRDSYPRFVNSPTYKDLLRTCGVTPTE